MNSETLLYAIGSIDDNIIEEASVSEVKAKKGHRSILMIAATVCLLVAVSAAALAVEAHRYNAAVGYLTSLGIDVKDLSDYSRSEIKEAVKTIAAGDSNALTEKILGSSKNKIERPTSPTKVTSEQVRELKPTMTSKEVISKLGATQDIGSGFLILEYEVDGKYLLRIPFAGNDAQLGVKGEDLLKALAPK